MNSQQDPAVLSRTIVVGTVVAAIMLLLLGLPWPVALLAGVGGFLVSRFTGKKLTDLADPSDTAIPGPSSEGPADEDEADEVAGGA